MGIVFDIQRACLHDGPGIRTTVFLKGCPLKCLWCHNPEGIFAQPQLSYRDEACVRCEHCADTCPNGVHQFYGPIHALEFDKCTLCGECIRQCDHSGLRVVGKDMSVEEVLKEVLADSDFYKNSGGGITLSGGEPLWQVEFSMELLQKSKGARIHTCIETSGCASSRLFKKSFEFTDLILFDYKISNPELHKRYTGVTNESILHNFALAYQSGVPIVLRCPIIPGVNDDKGHFRAICAIEKNYPGLLGIEIMPYHRMGTAKSKEIGHGENTLKLPSVDRQTRDLWMTQLRELGCTRITMG